MNLILSDDFRDFRNDLSDLDDRSRGLLLLAGRLDHRPEDVFFSREIFSLLNDRRSLADLRNDADSGFAI